MKRRLLLPLGILLAAACKDAGKPPTAPAAPSPAVDAVGEAAASYRVRGAVAPESLAPGARATLTLEIEMTRADVHVQQEFPLRIALSPSAGLTLAKEALGHADALDAKAKGRRWEVPITAAAKGPQRVTASMRFAICKEAEPAWCVTRNESVTAAVEVR